MKKKIFLCFCFAFLLLADAFAESSEGRYFSIQSDLDPCYVQLIQANAEAFYWNMQGRYFRTGWEKPLKIYYCRTQSDTQQLLDKNGHKIKVDYGFYDSREPAVYTHRLMNDGVVSGWGTLFHEIAHHFIQLNYKGCPEWFNEGLASFLGEQTRIVKGKLTIGRPNPWREQILRNEIELGHRPNIKRLFSSSAEQFNGWDLGRHFARAFFYWLYETGQLEQYLKNVQGKDYDISVLEETVSDSYGKINIKLLKFIKKGCYAGAYLQDGRQAKDEAGKIEAFLKALELKPDYQAAKLELAKCYYQNKDYESCRENLKKILDDPESVEYPQAAEQMADAYYDQKDYAKALEYYNKSWEYSDYYEYKHRTAYRIGNCYYHLKDPENTKKWYAKFLDCNWERNGMKASVDYARKYLGCATAPDETQGKFKETAKIDVNSTDTKQCQEQPRADSVSP
ncbi:MAG: tetratricopeptide repeat protein [Sedimentisphaerales bacterium]|nr:tetratricopeptide repeat protein [Sedimentisphaerales bacterium]